MRLFAQIVGIFAVITFLLSYQQKKRKNIIALNATSRVLYIIQYMMLGAFEGAALDVAGTVSSLAAQNRDKGFMKKYSNALFVIVNIVIIVIGAFLYRDIFSIFPVIGVLLHTSAFWITNEKTIRKISFLGSPFWLVYNIASQAYGSAIGDVLTMLSIGIAIYRYDIKKCNR